MSKRSRIIKVSKESNALKRLRILKGLSVRKAADALNISPTLVSHIELGRANISKTYIENFLNTLGFSREDWEMSLGGEKKLKTIVKDKLPQDLIKKISGLSEENLNLVQSIINRL